METKNNDLVVKHNNLVEAVVHMNRSEYNLFLLLLAKINKDKNHSMTQTISMQEYANMFDVDINHVYSQIKELKKNLIKRHVNIKNTKGDLKQITCFSSIDYLDSQAKIQIEINEKLKPFILELSTNFTAYYIDNVRDLTSLYAIRLYELLKQYEKIGERTFTIKQLREILSIQEDEYTKYDGFKRKVLNQPIRKINENTDIYITFEEIKTGRKVTSIKFIINKNKFREMKNNDKNNDDGIKKLQELFFAKTGDEISHDVISKLANIYGFDKVNNYISNIDKFDYNNAAAFLQTAIKNNYQFSQKTNKNKASNIANFEQRKYEDDFYKSLYENFK